MSTAGRATYDPAQGGKGKWEGDLSAQSKQYSVRDLPSHTRLKYRQEGQGKEDELRGRDFRKELEARETRHQQEKTAKAGGAALTMGREHHSSSRPSSSAVPALSSSAAGAATSQSQGPAAKKQRYEAPVNPDADEPLEDIYAEDSDASGSDAGSDDDNDDDQEILAELARIRQERAEEQARQEGERKAQEERIRMENILKGNPLITPTGADGQSVDFKVKRRWDDDVVFKNCARGEVDKTKRGYINDTLRSEFHKKFMDRYIK